MATAAGLKRQRADDQTEDPAKRKAGPANGSNSGSNTSRQANVSSRSSKTSANDQNEASWVTLRCLVSNREAAALIGSKGANVEEVRRSAGVRCNFSENVKGAAERILTVAGSVSSVQKACGMLVRIIFNEQPEEYNDLKVYNLRTILPNKALGPIIGKSGAGLREIRETSGAILTVADTMLPLSTERSMLIHGTADNIGHAVGMICQHLLDQAEKIAASHVQMYHPLPIYGTFGHLRHWRLNVEKGVATPFNPYGVAPTGYSAADYAADMGLPPPQTETQYEENTAGAAVPHLDTSDPSAHAGGGISVQTAQQQAQQAMPGQALTQQIYIPNDMVGAVIGKGGAKINEIRQLSGSSIKINEPQENSNERLVTISGTAESNQMALYLLHSRLENEKHR